MGITETERNSMLRKRLRLAAETESGSTENGKTAGEDFGPQGDRAAMARSLFGVLSTDLTLEEAEKERLDRI